jgi:hypothetical protein
MDQHFDQIMNHNTKTPDRDVEQSLVGVFMELESATGPASEKLRWTRDLLLPRPLSGQVISKTNDKASRV